MLHYAVLSMQHQLGGPGFIRNYHLIAFAYHTVILMTCANNGAVWSNAQCCCKLRGRRNRHSRPAAWVVPLPETPLKQYVRPGGLLTKCLPLL
jgi:hypothetical protein